MKAIIMAGGEGSRLRPLTCDCPKPMMRLMNRPIMQYAVELLAAHGVTEIAATLGFSSQSHLGKYFKRQTGMTPIQFRRRFAATEVEG